MNITIKCLCILAILLCLVPLTQLFYNADFGFTTVYGIVFYVLVFAYLITTFSFFKNMRFATIQHSTERFFGIVLLLVILFFYAENTQIISQYTEQFFQQTKSAGQEFQMLTPIWRAQHCTQVADPKDTCLKNNSGIQKYQCDDGSTYCGEN